MATRRAVLGRVALGLGVAACGGWSARAEGAAYVGVETSAADGRSRAAFFAAGGARLGATPLDFRAHGLARHGDALAVFPRRPGDRFALVSLSALTVRAVAAAPSNRRFYGHGAFTADGTRLLVAEADLTTLGGAIGVYEVAPRLRRLGQVALPGPGPHEIVRAAGAAERFHIALGGLETHPDYGRTPLNLASFRSRTLSLDLATGAVESLGDWPGADGVSLRHLAQDGAGRLYVGGQVARPGRDGPGGVLWLVEGGAARPLEAGRLLGGYVSSVAADGPRAVVTSKTAGVALTLEAGAAVARTPLDGASAAGAGGGLAAVAGYRALRLGAARAEAAAGLEFDNHGLVIA